MLRSREDGGLLDQRIGQGLAGPPLQHLHPGMPHGPTQPAGPMHTTPPGCAVFLMDAACNRPLIDCQNGLDVAQGSSSNSCNDCVAECQQQDAADCRIGHPGLYPPHRLLLDRRVTEQPQPS